MEIYIEYVIIDNMTINSFLLLAAALSMRLKVRWWQIFLSAAIGTAFACLLPLIEIHPVFLVGIKILLAPLMILTAFAPINFKKLIWSTLIFAAYTFVLGGVIIAFIYAGMNMTLSKAAVYYSASVPVGAYLLGLGAFVFLIYKINAYIKSEKKLRKSLKKVRLTLNGRNYEVYGFVDNGNSMTSGEYPVCFVSGRNLAESLKKEIAESALSNKKLCGGEYVTVAGVSKFVGLEKEIAVDGKIRAVVLANARFATYRYDIILNEIFGEEDYANN